MSIKDIKIKNHTYYFFDDVINIKVFDPNNIDIDEKPYKNILIYYIGYVTIKKDLKIYSVNLLYLVFTKGNGYFEDINGTKYLTLVPTNKRKEKIKKYEEMWIKITDLIKSVIKKSDDYNEKYMRIKFDTDNKLPLNKTIEIPIIAIVVSAVFHENNKYYPQVFFRWMPMKYKWKIINFEKLTLKITAIIRYFLLFS